MSDEYKYSLSINGLTITGTSPIKLFSQTAGSIKIKSTSGKILSISWLKNCLFLVKDGQFCVNLDGVVHVLP